RALLGNPVRKIGFYSALGLVFLQYSRLHEMLSFLAGSSTFLLYLFTVPGVLAFLGSGRARQAFQETAVRCWLGFLTWAVIAIPFSYWRGGSFTVIFGWFKGALPIMLLLATLPITWKEVRRVLYVIALGGIVIIVMSRFFASDWGGGRTGIEFGVIGNPND